MATRGVIHHLRSGRLQAIVVNAYETHSAAKELATSIVSETIQERSWADTTYIASYVQPQW